jgi:acyl carrier protein
MPKERSVADRVKEIIVEHLVGMVNPSQVHPNAKFIEDFGCDELDHVELVMAFEEEFQFEISDEDAEKLLRVRDAVKYVEENTPPKHSV